MRYLEILSNSIGHTVSLLNSILNPIDSSEVLMSYRDGKKTIETILVKRRFGKPEKIKNEWISVKEPQPEPIPYIHVYVSP